MNKNDERLVQQAEQTTASRWFEICDLMEQAESKEARERLRIIKCKKYHEEEYRSWVD